ncbi:MAG: hypothetical protein LC644_04980, partial [Pseudonocardia sp.]|nr:hypothetical protein [Pseudonocardia sp.]
DLARCAASVRKTRREERARAGDDSCPASPAELATEPLDGVDLPDGVGLPDLTEAARPLVAVSS